MAASARIRATIEVDHGSRPITGKLLVEDDVPRHFTGWIELTAALERMRAGPPRPSQAREAARPFTFDPGATP